VNKIPRSRGFHRSGISVRLLAFVTPRLPRVPLLCTGAALSSSCGEDRRADPHRAERPTRFSRALAPRFSEIWGQPVLVRKPPRRKTRSSARSMCPIGARWRHPADLGRLLVRDQPSPVQKLPYNGLKSSRRSRCWCVSVGHRRARLGSREHFRGIRGARESKAGSRCSLPLPSPGSSAHIKRRLPQEPARHGHRARTLQGRRTRGHRSPLSGQIQMMMVTPLLVEFALRALGRLKLLAAATARRDCGYLSFHGRRIGLPGLRANVVRADGARGPMPRATVARIYDDHGEDPSRSGLPGERYVTKQWFEVVGTRPSSSTEYHQIRIRRWARLIEPFTRERQSSASQAPHTSRATSTTSSSFRH